MEWRFLGKELVFPIDLVTPGRGLVKSGISHSPNPGMLVRLPRLAYNRGIIITLYDL